MAEYQIGQYRFEQSKAYISDVSSTLQTYMTVSEDFKDVAIKSDFKAGKDYYVSLTIPKDINYDMDFRVLLTNGNADSTEFQFIKNLSIPRGGEGKNVYPVALYEKAEGGEPVAMIPLPYDPSKRSTNGYIYIADTHDIKTTKYYLGNRSGGYTLTNKVVNNSMIASWRENNTNVFSVFEFAFRPVEDFKYLLVEMNRNSIDYNIQHTNTNGDVYFGREIDIEDMSYELYEVQDLAPSLSPVTHTLSRIGVWAHPGLVMCINGEEIKIGPSSYYELGTLPVESLGIVAKDFRDNFTLDYQYITEIE